MMLESKDCRFEIFKKGCAAMDSGDYEEAARQFWILFSEMDKLVKIDKIKKDCFGAEASFITP